MFVCLRSYGVMTPMFRGCVADYDLPELTSTYRRMEFS